MNSFGSCYFFIPCLHLMDTLGGYYFSLLSNGRKKVTPVQLSSDSRVLSMLELEGERRDCVEKWEELLQ